MKALLLYIATAITEMVGCYLLLLWLRGQDTDWLLLPAAAFREGLQNPGGDRQM